MIGSNGFNNYPELGSFKSCSSAKVNESDARPTKVL